MGSCSSKEEGFHPIQQERARPPTSSSQQHPPSRSKDRRNRPQPAADSDNNRPRRSKQQRNKHSRGAQHSAKSKDKNRGPARNRCLPQNNNQESQSVVFQDFNDQEKDLVDTLLETNKTLRFAAINFEELRLDKIIGTGAFGEVIRGSYQGTPVVVKRMLRNKIDENNVRLFAEEIQLMMNLRHPNIVQFIGASWNSYSNVCFVTEYLERGDLFSVLRNPKYRLTWQEPILRMMIDICRGMAYLHGLPDTIIHRDLKSMNILVNTNFSCKVSDFGLSREKSVDETMSVTGTPLWLPPEMIRGERYNEKADVYSFGIVMSEFDTRKIPYHDIKAKGARYKKVSGSTLMHMVAYDQLRPSMSPKCMKSVLDLYARCTASESEDRPSFTEIVRELEGPVREETFSQEANVIERPVEAGDVTPEELGVKHATHYSDDTLEKLSGNQEEEGHR